MKTAKNLAAFEQLRQDVMDDLDKLEFGSNPKQNQQYEENKEVLEGLLKFLTTVIVHIYALKP